MEIGPDEEVALRTRANMGRSYLGIPSLFMFLTGIGILGIAQISRTPEFSPYGVYVLGAALAVYLMGELLNVRRARARSLVQMIDRERNFSSTIPPLE